MFRKEETKTQRLTKRTLRVAKKLSQSPNSDTAGDRNDHEHGPVPARAGGLLSPPHISSIYKVLAKAGQLELRRRSRVRPLHQDQSIDEGVVRQGKGHFSGL